MITQCSLIWKRSRFSPERLINLKTICSLDLTRFHHHSTNKFIDSISASSSFIFRVNYKTFLKEKKLHSLFSTVSNSSHDNEYSIQGKTSISDMSDVDEEHEYNLKDQGEDGSVHVKENQKEEEELYRLSKIISAYASNLAISRNKAERLIRDGNVTVAGITIPIPHFLISLEEAAHSGIKVGNTLLQINTKQTKKNHGKSNDCDLKQATRVWLAHKLPGELVTEEDPYNRPSLLQRLRRGGVGTSSSSSKRVHLKPIGRLDMQTEGLIILTNDGEYAQEMEHPRNQFHRTYRVRAFGNLTESKLNAMRKGTLEVDGIKYDQMKVTIDREQGGRKRRMLRGGKSPANTWLQVTCREGKNRMIRKVFDHLGLKVTRLIRVSFGDYTLQQIQPGMAMEVSVKELETQKHKGPLFGKFLGKKPTSKKVHQTDEDQKIIPIQWIKNR